MTARPAALALAGALGLAACAPKTPPVAPTPLVWRQPALTGIEPPELARRYAEAWGLIRQGDRDQGARRLTGLVRATPSFAPGWASLGELSLARRDYAAATADFARAVAAAPGYGPAHVGAVDAALGRGDDRAALVAIDRLLGLPEGVVPAEALGDAHARRAVVELRIVERVLADVRARERAGDLAGARVLAADGLAVMPNAAGLLNAGARVALALGDADEASALARRAIALDDRDPVAHGLLADSLERAGRFEDAAAAATLAFALDPSPARRDRRDALVARAGVALPAPLRDLASARTVTRGQVAAWIALRLSGVVSDAPRRQTVVVTDLRGHWASAPAQRLLDAGWMTARPNHTFEPDGPVTRADLAVVVAAALPDVMAGREAQLARWRAATPSVPGLPPAHAAAPAIRVAVAAGIMTTEGDLFTPGQLVSGAELVAVVARLERAAR